MLERYSSQVVGGIFWRPPGRGGGVLRIGSCAVSSIAALQTSQSLFKKKIGHYLKFGYKRHKQVSDFLIENNPQK